MTREEARNYVLNTKVYVGKNSKEIQEKLFKLGYRWRSEDSSVENLEFPFMFIHGNHITRASNMELFNSHRYREISAEDILNIKVEKECKLKPFDKVLVRSTKSLIWEIGLFERIEGEYYLCIAGIYKECIPYNEETAHLLGTKEDYNE